MSVMHSRWREITLKAQDCHLPEMDRWIYLRISPGVVHQKQRKRREIASKDWMVWAGAEAWVNTAGRSLEAILWAARSTKSYWFFSSQNPSLISLLFLSLDLCILLRRRSVQMILPAWLTLGRNADISLPTGMHWCVCVTVTSWQRHKLHSHSNKTFYSTVRFFSLPGGGFGLH